MGYCQAKSGPQQRLMLTNFSEIVIEIQFFIKENAFKMSSVQLRLFCLGLNVLNMNYEKWHIRWGIAASPDNSLLKKKKKSYSFKI